MTQWTTAPNGPGWYWVQPTKGPDPIMLCVVNSKDGLVVCDLVPGAMLYDGQVVEWPLGKYLLVHTGYRWCKAEPPSDAPPPRAWLDKLQEYLPNEPVVQDCALYETAREAWDNWPAKYAADMMLLLIEIDADELAIIRAHIEADVAERYLPYFEKQYPGDDRIRRLIDAARKYATAPTDANQWALHDTHLDTAVRCSMWDATNPDELQAQRDIVLTHCPFELIEPYLG